MMSPLCTRYFLLIKNKMKERPSPNTIHSLLISRCKGLLSIPVWEPTIQSPIIQYIKGISAFTFLRKSVKGSMTVEATLLLPLFIFFVLSMGNAIEMIRLHGKLELAMWNAGNDVSIYGYTLTDEKLLSMACARNQVEDLLGKEYLDTSPLTRGAKGLNFWETKLLDDGRFELVLTYEVNPDMGMLGMHSFRMANRYYGHIWNGYDISVTNPDNQQAWVYVAENGTVYHEARDCTHLMLSTRAVTYAEALIELNENGERYTACRMCGTEEYRAKVYITQSGNCYHFLRECSGLKRTVYTIPRGAVEGYLACSRCS